MTVIGTGYNSEVFKKTGIKSSRKDGKIRMIFAGKITQKKGVKSLLRALNLLDYEKEKYNLFLPEVPETSLNMKRLKNWQMDADIR